MPFFSRGALNLRVSLEKSKNCAKFCVWLLKGTNYYIDDPFLSDAMGGLYIYLASIVAGAWGIYIRQVIYIVYYILVCTFFFLLWLAHFFNCLARGPYTRSFVTNSWEIVYNMYFIVAAGKEKKHLFYVKKFIYLFIYFVTKKL